MGRARMQEGENKIVEEDRLRGKESSRPAQNERGIFAEHHPEFHGGRFYLVRAWIDLRRGLKPRPFKTRSRSWIFHQASDGRTLPHLNCQNHARTE